MLDFDSLEGFAGVSNTRTGDTFRRILEPISDEFTFNFDDILSTRQPVRFFVLP